LNYSENNEIFVGGVFLAAPGSYIPYNFKQLIRPTC